ncbi:glycoside hydrolase superfamily [Stachybotrys elegans]|uniref:endo-1,4-beta-xylanase n=1 Tax=Stachybotrys elegans TaxID=80388 RepID=A0A8K0WJD9_9HYPO|nr:glycoside hydrolase superfamily [Stachybotrys elegans]
MYFKLFLLGLLGSRVVRVTAQLNQLAQAAGLDYFGLSNNGDLVPVQDNRSEFGRRSNPSLFEWGALETTQGRFTFDAADRFVNQAISQGQRVHCANLVDGLDLGLPQWLSQGTWTKPKLHAVLENHVTRVVRHFRGRCSSWDVVSRATDLYFDSELGGVFYRILGPEFVAISFHAARIADPAAKLYYHPWTWSGVDNDATSNSTFRLLNRLVNASAPIDGVSLGLGNYSGDFPQKGGLVASLGRFVALGLEINLSDLLIYIPAGMPSSECWRTQQLEAYEAVTAACLRVCQCLGRFLTKTWHLVTTSNSVLYYTDANGTLARTSIYGAIESRLREREEECVPTSTSPPTPAPTRCPAPLLPHWAQCGGWGWYGPTECQEQYTCTYVNVDYSQCL